MPTLHERLIGTSVTEAEPKLPIHSFIGIIMEWDADKITGPEAKAMIPGLTAAQESQLQVLKNLYTAAPDPMKFLRVFKNWLYMGETSTDARYLDQGNLIARLQAEVTEQGGTLP